MTDEMIKELREIAEQCKGHTPGPWDVCHNVFGMHSIEKRKDEDWTISEKTISDYVPARCKEDEANAHALAASPRLLEIALQLAEENERLRGMVKSAYMEGSEDGHSGLAGWLDSDAFYALQHGEEGDHE